VTVPYPKRLIEVDLPIKRISAHARREKSIRHGHISTLHVWWARRPLAACRAVILATLWPDPADESCPEGFRAAARDVMLRWAREFAKKASPESYERLGRVQKDPAVLDDPAQVRKCLLDFIADFSNWDNSNDPAYLETSRALVQAAHEAVGGEVGTRPLVVDPFAGGGAIPLEALRVGANAFASDLNPVAVLLNKVLLEYIPKHGHRLADEVRKWGEWVKKKAEAQVADLYPRDPDGGTPIAYLWARTIKCEGPGCGTELPLLGQPWLSTKAGRRAGLQLKGSRPGGPVQSALAFSSAAKVASIVRGGAATCPCCGHTTASDHVKKQLAAANGGTRQARMLCVVTTHPAKSGRVYRLPGPGDLKAVETAQGRLRALRIAADDRTPVSLPAEPTPPGEGKGAGRAFAQRGFGMLTMADLYTARQGLTLTTLASVIRTDEALLNESPAIRTLMALALGRVNDLSMSLCRWLPSLEAVASANGGQNRMPVVFDFIEANPFGGSGGDWMGQIDWIARVVDHVTRASIANPGSVQRCEAQTPFLPADSADALVTDPPYYDAFPYSDLSDFYLVWLRRALGGEGLGYTESLSPKVEEAVVYDIAHGGDVVKDRGFYQSEMTRAFVAARQTAKPSALGVVVFANKTTAGWEALIASLIDAGWTATASWPIDTERPNRQRALGSAALGSSVHVVCRPRETDDGSLRSKDVGDWRDVLAELPIRIREWMPRLADEGVVGADAIFACLGPALEIFSRYSRVEKASGDQVTLREYLEHVWAAVAREALSMIFADAETSGFEEDARLTAMWLWTVSAGSNGASGNDPGNGDDSDDEGEATSTGKKTKVGGFALEYDAARKIAQGLGAHLEDLTSLVEVKGETARLLPVAERTRALFGKNEADAPSARRKKKAQQMKLGFAEELEEAEETGGWGQKGAPKLGETVLDRVHQSMILFAAGRGEALRRFLVDEGAGRDGRFWRLAQALAALYPTGTDERRWVEGMLARKKGLGF